MRRALILVWALADCGLLALGLCGARAAVSSDAPVAGAAMPCQRAEALRAHLVLRGFVVGVSGAGARDFLAAAWRITGGGDPPPSDRFYLARFPGARHGTSEKSDVLLIGIYPIVGGLVCRQLIVSPAVLKRIVGEMRDRGTP